MLPPASVLSVGTTTTDALLLSGAFVLRGWSFGETTGAAAATAALYDGADATTLLVAPIGLASGASSVVAIPGNGLILRQGLFLDVSAGSVIGSVWYTALTHAADIEVAHGEWGPVFVRPGA